MPKAASWITPQSARLYNYLPGFNIPMLPRELSDDLCSLRANEVRPLACRMTLAADGTIEDNIEFFAATIESKASWPMTTSLTGWKAAAAGNARRSRSKLRC